MDVIDKKTMWSRRKQQASKKKNEGVLDWAEEGAEEETRKNESNIGRQTKRITTNMTVEAEEAEDQEEAKNKKQKRKTDAKTFFSENPH